VKHVYDIKGAGKVYLLSVDTEDIEHYSLKKYRNIFCPSEPY
jgi:hypothetical protein